VIRVDARVPDFEMQGNLRTMIDVAKDMDEHDDRSATAACDRQRRRRSRRHRRSLILNRGAVVVAGARAAQIRR
jgi:hypothetical protein